MQLTVQELNSITTPLIKKILILEGEIEKMRDCLEKIQLDESKDIASDLAFDCLQETDKERLLRLEGKEDILWGEYFSKIENYAK